LAPKIQSALAREAGVERSELDRPHVQQAVFNKLRAATGADAQHLLGQRVASAARSLRAAEGIHDEEENALHGFGYRLLPEDDAAFSNPKYWSGVLLDGGQRAAGYPSSLSHSEQRFESAWKRLAPANTKVVAYTMTGSDANNLLYSVARANAYQRLVAGRPHQGWQQQLFPSYVAGARRERDPEHLRASDAEILFVGRPYAGGRGKITGASLRSWSDAPHTGAPDLRDFEVTSPHTPYWRPRILGR
jgi:hypothetical protein